MADTLIGTAGIFFTLVLIALASFFIGLIIFGVVDLLKVRRGQRSRHHHSARRGTLTVSPLTLADRLHRAARHAAEAVFETNGGSPGSPPASAEAQWRVAVEFTAALLQLTDTHLEARLRPGHGDAYLRALGDLCAGNLFRAHPAARSAPVHLLLAEARAAFAASGPAPQDLNAPSPDLDRLLAGRVAAWVPGSPDAQQLQTAVSRLMRSLVAVDIAPCLK